MDIDNLLNDESLVRECPACEGWAIPFGILGNLIWYICNDCGMEFNIKSESEK